MWQPELTSYTSSFFLFKSQKTFAWCNKINSTLYNVYILIILTFLKCIILYDFWQNSFMWKLRELFANPFTVFIYCAMTVKSLGIPVTRTQATHRGSAGGYKLLYFSPRKPLLGNWDSLSYRREFSWKRVFRPVYRRIIRRRDSTQTFTFSSTNGLVWVRGGGVSDRFFFFLIAMFTQNTANTWETYWTCLIC